MIPDILKTMNEQKFLIWETSRLFLKYPCMTAQCPGKNQFLLFFIVVPLATPAPVNELCLRMCLGLKAKWTGMVYANARQRLSVSERRGSRRSTYREWPPQLFNCQNTKTCPVIVWVQHCLQKDSLIPGKVLFTSTAQRLEMFPGMLGFIHIDTAFHGSPGITDVVYGP